MSENECEKDCKICKLEMFMNPSWRKHLEQEFETQYFRNIKSSLHANNVIYPPVDQIFSFSRFFDIEDTKVVIIGQDPYHGKGQANGLAFSVNKGIKLPPSLRNILKEVSACYAKCGQTGNEENNENNSKTAKPLIKPNMDGDLVRWAKQGVLLLNDCLTVIENKPNSHKKLGWNTFTDKIIKLINTECKNVVFMLWGNFAQAKEDLIDKEKHLVLKTTHPSPFSCRKGFLGCRHFEIANKYLDENGKGAVCWHGTNDG